MDAPHEWFGPEELPLPYDLAWVDDLQSVERSALGLQDARTTPPDPDLVP